MNRYFDPLIIGGTTYDFPHLEPSTLIIPSERVKRDLRVRVRYTTHCFSVSHDPLLHLGGEYIFKDDGGRDRAFCPDRYALSQLLPGIMKGLEERPDVKVTQTAARRNFVYTVKIERPDGPYFVFFEMRQVSSNQQDLMLTVESAYVLDSGNSGPTVLGNMKFDTLCTKRYLGEPVTTKR